MNHLDLDTVIEVAFPAENFLKITETLRRSGKKLEGKNLKQIAYLFHKRGRYWILHYKQMRIMDGEEGIDLTPDDERKTDIIISVLRNWNLLDVVNPEDKGYLLEPNESINGEVKIVPHKEKYRWTFHSPYNIGQIE